MSDNGFKWTLTFVLLSVLLIVGITSVHKRGYFGAGDSSNRFAWDTNAALTDDSVRRILVAEFNGVIDLDDTVISPSYTSGDFNGDGVLDLAAAVRVNMEVSAADTSRPPFRFEKVIGPGPSDKPVTPIEMTTGRLKWYQDHHSSILAIVHGSEEYGLRNTKPEQRFVLVDGWSRGKLKAHLYKGELKIARYGDEAELVPPPVLLGSAIVLVNIDNNGDAIYWDGTAYRWYHVPDPPITLSSREK